MRDRPRREFEVDEGDVRRVREDAAPAHRGDACRRLSQPVAQDREVVRGEVPDHTYVRLVQPQIHSAHRDEVEVTERARHDQIADQVHGWAVEERMAGHECQPLRLRHLDEG